MYASNWIKDIINDDKKEDKLDLMYDITTMEGFQQALGDEEFITSIISDSQIQKAPVSAILGDVDGNSMVDIVDELMIAQHYVGFPDVVLTASTDNYSDYVVVYAVEPIPFYGFYQYDIYRSDASDGVYDLVVEKGTVLMMIIILKLGKNIIIKPRSLQMMVSDKNYNYLILNLR